MDDPTILEALRTYFLACPLTGNDALRIDWLPEQGIAYSIDTTPSTAVLEHYIGGSSLRQYVFVLRSVAEYGPDVLQNISNCGFYEKLAAWMEQQTRLRRFPDLGTGRTVRTLEAQTTGYLFTTGPNFGRYQIQCRMIYYQKGTR